MILVGRAAVGFIDQGCLVPRLVPAIGAALRWPEAVTVFYCQPTGGYEGYGNHPSCALRGVQYGGKFGKVQLRLCHERVAVYTSVRGCLERSRRSVLGRAPDGRELHGRVRTELLPAMGYSRSLARVGTVTSRKEWLHGARLESVAKHPQDVWVVNNQDRGSNMLTKNQIAADIADDTGVGQNLVKHVLDSLAELAAEEIKAGEDFTIPGVVRLSFSYRAPLRKGAKYKKGETYTGFGGVEQTAEEDSKPVTEMIKLKAFPVGAVNQAKPGSKPEAQKVFLKSAAGKAVRTRKAK